MTTIDMAPAFRNESMELIHRADTMVAHNHRLKGSEARLVKDMAARLGELEGELSLLRSRDRENQAVRLAKLLKTHLPAHQTPYQVYALVGDILDEKG